MTPNRFLELLSTACERVGQDYVMLAVAGGSPIYRERVYCYELYHQFRLLTGNVPAEEPRLFGEVDKKGHPSVSDDIKGTIPDFLVHVPGSMEFNVACVEVKMAGRLTKDNAIDDWSKLLSFITPAATFKPYAIGAWLLVGDAQGPVIEWFSNWAKTVGEGAQKLVLLHHRKPGARLARLH